MRPHPRVWLDVFEKVVLVTLLGSLAYRLVPHLEQKPVNALFLISETFVVAMIACRQSTTRISVRPTDWLVGFGGTFLPLVVRDGTGAGVGGGVLMLMGFVVSVGAQLSLRRSLGVVAANRGVKTSGLYGIVRHPMYLGYFCTQIGFSLANPTGWNAGILALCLACQVCRIHAEERLLSDDLEYQAFKRRVHYRLVPRIY
jgi:protein-S-isoprenylcysteine O-methyltransferase Ste14